MDDITLAARLDDGTMLYVTPVHDQTYDEFVENDNLGGPNGYFITRQRRCHFEVLGKATSLDAAREIFALLTSSRVAS